MTAEQAGGLLSYGGPGFTIIVLMLLVGPIVTALVWQMRAIARGFTGELTAAREEREAMAERYERLVNQHTGIGRSMTRGLERLCAQLGSRPCMIGLNPGNENTEAQDASD